MEILSKILGSSARVKLMRLFLLNSSQPFKAKDIAKRSRINTDILRKELRLLESVGFIKKSKIDFIFNNSFKYKKEFENLLLESDSLDKNEIANNFKKSGKIKLLLVSGIFIKDKESRVDIFIVGDNLKKNKIEEEIKRLEADMGIELVYALFDTKEFNYRLNMYDKLVRDVLDFPHEVILESKELSTQSLKKR